MTAQINTPSTRELEIIKKSISFEDKGNAKEYLMAENSAGQKAIYCIPNDGSTHYREVTGKRAFFRNGLPELVAPENFETWEGRGYVGGHISQSHWDTDQESNEMFRLICSGYIVLDKTTKGNVSGYRPKVIYWKDKKND